MYFIGKFGFDTAENEPAKNSQKVTKFRQLRSRRRGNLDRGVGLRELRELGAAGPQRLLQRRPRADAALEVEVGLRSRIK